MNEMLKIKYCLKIRITINTHQVNYALGKMLKKLREYGLCIKIRKIIVND